MTALCERVGGAELSEEPAAYDVQPCGVDAETWYSPGRVAGYLERWAELRELACPTAQAVRYDGNLSQHTPGRKPPDATRYVEIMADIERAWCQLPIWSIEWNAVKCLMDGHPLREMEVCYRLRHGTAYEAFRTATRTMAEYLGWRE